MRSRLVTVSVLALALAAACSDTESSSPPTTVGCKEAASGRVTIVAQEGNRWDTDCLRAPAGPLTIEVDNRDDGGNHNIHLPDAPDSPATELELGPSTQELEVTLDPGSYEFLCDIHTNMVGTLMVAAPRNDTPP